MAGAVDDSTINIVVVIIIIIIICQLWFRLDFVCGWLEADFHIDCKFCCDGAHSVYHLSAGEG